MLVSFLALLLPVSAEFNNGDIDRIEWEGILNPTYGATRRNMKSNSTFVYGFMSNSSKTQGERKAFWLANNDNMVALNSSLASIIGIKVKNLSDLEYDLQLREQAAAKFFVTKVTDKTTRSRLEKSFIDTGSRINATLQLWKVWSAITVVPHYPTNENLVYLGKTLCWEFEQILKQMKSEQVQWNDWMDWWLFWGKNLGTI